ncbi:hypothetical protein SERLA73DRAFT_128894 [Serpula lacrymans var. lacrymans S7.3]|uniref:Uncharacterized protein n=2 Tax=Serpula lacrymans var. lacrymans TaxID=341189 RepID=F8PIB7_SERL3|nr:uncharacterized protein SERLADRAFT_364622 [Serpula lacrymans var. lacrymans S7.9]EGO05160.1 hypothetical protein SERLA73DRAFT_128894 [Serpula lacrymans var. lacrymans S7.3]EGO30902.1 hypothetical protein SERLADRAFT_364622 [Serpula lacrymans var. lacrymans S7.9]
MVFKKWRTCSFGDKHKGVEVEKILQTLCMLTNVQSKGWLFSGIFAREDQTAYHRDAADFHPNFMVVPC